MKSFIVKLTLLTLSIAVIGWAVFSLFLNEYYLPVFPLLLLFFYVVTIGIQKYQLSLLKKDVGKFVRSNMLITLFKLIVYSLVAVLYIVFDTENAMSFVIGLMLLYLVFTFFEVREATKLSKPENDEFR